MPSPNQQERVNAELCMPLSRGMLSVLSNLMNAIDRRVNMINVMAEAQEGCEADTCDNCGGTGLVIVQTAIRPKRASVTTQTVTTAPEVGEGAGNAHTSRRRTYSDNSDVGNYTGEMVESLGLNRPAPTRKRLRAISGRGGISPEPAVAPAVSTPDPVVPTVPAVPAVAAVPTGGPASAIPVTPASVAVPAGAADVASAVAAVPAGGPAPAVAATLSVGPWGPVPAPSTVIPGLNYLGPNHPIPHPQDAVFCVAGGDRFYTVIKGIRVGVFSGWLSTGAYVTGVPSAAQSKHTTIEAAYDDYCRAFHARLVSYV